MSRNRRFIAVSAIVISGIALAWYAGMERPEIHLPHVTIRMIPAAAEKPHPDPCAAFSPIIDPSSDARKATAAVILEEAHPCYRR